MSFIQPCLLVLLHREEAHGYSLFNGLNEFGFRPGQQDPSLVYRALRNMEAAGLLSSRWDDDSRGPQRRVYSITQDGAQRLDEWAADLARARQEIDHLLSEYNQAGQ